MDLDEPGWPLIDDYFTMLADGRKPATVRRYARVRLRLYDYLDVDDMTDWLTPEAATLLAAEREFVRAGAVWSLFGLEGVIRCLPGFVAAANLPTSGAEARMQLSVVDRFLVYVRAWHAVPEAGQQVWLVARRAVRDGKRAVEARERSPELQRWFDEIDARFPPRTGTP